MEGPGEINHIWITVDNKTTDADCFVLRDLVIRMYWMMRKHHLWKVLSEISFAVVLEESVL